MDSKIPLEEYYCYMKDIFRKEDKDIMNYPAYYTQGKIEVLDFIEDQKLDYHEGNIIKYICRYKYKNGLEDLKKARFYLDRLIKNKEG